MSHQGNDELKENEYEQLQEELISLDNEYECSIASGTHRTPEEIAQDVYTIINKLKWSEDEAYDYIDFIKERC